MHLARSERPGSEREASSSAHPWWLAASEFKASIESQPAPPPITAHYQFGGGHLHIESHTTRLLEMFEQLYGDCAIADPIRSAPRVRCVVRRGDHPPLLLLTFLEGAPPDPAAAFMPMRETRVWDSPQPGWRFAGFEAEPILAACGPHVLVNLGRAWERFPIEYLATATLTAQADLIAVHAASLERNEAGLLLAGFSGSGKTTTALHLAARGLNLLGDEVALIRPATNGMLPFRRTANLRPGPRGQELAGAIANLSREYGLPADEEGVVALRISRLFPESKARAAQLRAAFFMAGFADHTSVERFRPKLGDLEKFGLVGGNEIATMYGLPPARRALRLLAITQLLDRLPCWRVTAGAPEETAEHIERKMEDLKC